MDPRITNKKNNINKLSFTLSNVDISIANSIRRTLLSDIEIVVFETTPYENNKANIKTNTTRLNNEVLKQRLSCIPIHITDREMPIQNYVMELDVKNNTDSMLIVTTEDFKIKNLSTDEYLSDKDTKDIFPPNELTGSYIDFVRLRPKISNDIPGEQISMTCEFSWSSARSNGMYNVVSTCAYGFTQDVIEVNKHLEKKKQSWKDEGLSKDDIVFESNNWKTLDAQRIITKNSYDFTVETVGIYTNKDLISKACDNIILKMNKLKDEIDKDIIPIEPAQNTMKNSYDITLINEDYTIGKVMEYLLYSEYYENNKTMSYCGFKKMHPHETESTIRVAYVEPTEKSGLKNDLIESIDRACKVYNAIKDKI